MIFRVGVLTGAPADRQPVELVERKGLGHPDTICDAIAEAFARRLCRFYLERFGVILHHNVDKALLRGGAARPAFGGGEVLEPVELWLGGRATDHYRGVPVPVAELAEDAARGWISRHLRALDPARHVRVHCLTRPGSSDLVDLFASGGGAAPLANDTSFGVGFAPDTPLERAARHVEQQITAGAARAAHPEWGEDVKVLGWRNDAETSLTVACAFVDAFVPDLATYRAQRNHLHRTVLDTATRELGRAPELAVNAADDLDAGRVYLTVTGTSAEAGDDGEVGRGNRPNGLITPQRPMTLEADAGKNPVTHVGKLYGWAAPRIASAVVSGIEGIEESQCILVSRIGRAVDQPALVAVELRTADGAPVEPLRARVEEIARAELTRLTGPFWKEWLDLDG